HRVTAHEQQRQRVIFGRILLIGCRRQPLVRGDPRRHECLPPAARLLTAQFVGHTPGGDPDEPPARALGHAVLGPAQGRRQQRFLDRVLGCVEVPEPPCHGAEDLRSEFAKQVLDAGVHGPLRHAVVSGAASTGCTSIGMFSGAPPCPGAADMTAAISIARSALSTSTIRYPARNSLDSGNGPSVTAGNPLSCARTILAISGPPSPCSSTSSPDSVSSLLVRCWNSMCRF